mmetsp:Transcript_40253/g.108757  ORF Transcript_40253/g.108757 Transcript_40253/m.108757 type:complete len:196 (-) Transcript_40253:67-654(-)|eukprot:CAMPEP_0171257092 /NCGR_PEP_ID=MMETSP0790-20130122/53658_1 /TAXON_ID=2925 /ORGANISM="Alexandrium catenella, Strain OF101" /LENGTH=195 /DNA_ID=CAMNT_0011725173 /DNA_START=126 /DNA_END=713 /DNA_ORIENTATION=+
MPFGSCAACEHVDKSEENFQTHLQRDGKIDYAPVTEDAPPVTGPSDDAPPEKSRLREFVKDFAKCAVRGVRCEVVDAQTGNAFPAAYFVDPPLQRLTLRRSEPGEGPRPEPPHRELEMAHIKDIHDLDSAKAAQGPNGSLVPAAVLRACEKDRLVVITFDGETPPAFILEGSAVDRDRFIMCVKILKLYAQNAQG